MSVSSPAMSRLVRLFRTSMPMSELLGEALVEVAGEFQADFTCVCLTPRDGGIVEVIGSWSRLGVSVDLRSGFDFQRSLLLGICEGGDAYHVADLREVEHLHHEELALIKAGQLSVLAVPLIYRSITSGGLLISSSRSSNFEAVSTQELAQDAGIQLAALIQHHQMEALSGTDFLTGLGNRRELENRLSAEIARNRRQGTPFSLLVMDLDRFKQINDEGGHRAGDEVLVKLAEIMRLVFREVDVVCRYGGDEFAVVLPGAPLEVAIGPAERLCQTVAAELPLLGVSVGMACCPADGIEPQVLLDRADAGCYAAKSGDLGKVVHMESEAIIRPPARGATG